MKALSIRQPWATMIIQGHKPVENRTWKTTYRGPLLIHAAKKYDYDGEWWIKENFQPTPGLVKAIEDAQRLRGGVIGSATMTDCVMIHPSPWFAGPYGFVFQNPKSMEFGPCPGKLNFFDIPIDLPGKSAPVQLDLFRPQAAKEG